MVCIYKVVGCVLWFYSYQVLWCVLWFYIYQVVGFVLWFYSYMYDNVSRTMCPENVTTAEGVNEINVDVSTMSNQPIAFQLMTELLDINIGCVLHQLHNIGWVLHQLHNIDLILH